MPRGGRREGAGRKPGAANIRTREIADRAQAEGLAPLEYLLGLMRDETQPQSVRFEAAKAIAPYMHPRLATIEHAGAGDRPMRFETIIYSGVLAEADKKI